MKIKIPVSSAAASPAGVSTSASSTRNVLIVGVDNEGLLIVPPRSLPG